MHKKILGILIVAVVFFSTLVNVYGMGTKTYISFLGDSLSEDITPQKRSYIPIMKDGDVLFNVNIDETSSVFMGDPKFVLTCKFSLLLLDNDRRTTILLNLKEVKTREDLVELVGEKIAKEAEILTEEYIDVINPPQETTNAAKILMNWLRGKV